MQRKKFNSFSEAVTWVMGEKQMSNREAQDFVWDNAVENSYLKVWFLTIF
jgi:hypothetical protein